MPLRKLKTGSGALAAPIEAPNEPLADTVSSGMRFFRRDARNDYLLIGYGPRDLMESKAEHLRPVITERAEVRRLYDDQ